MHWVFVAAVASLLFAAPSHAKDDATVTEDVLRILNERGIIDNDEYVRLQTKNAAYEEKHNNPLPKLQWYGDFRARHESFWYDDDKFDTDQPNRFRLRYLLRLGAVAKINDHIDLKFRLATGNDHDSRNQTLGSGVDFDPDSFNIDLAYIEWKPFLDLEPSVPGGKLSVQFGKVPNLFRWKVGKDWLLWDSDITLEGVAVKFSSKPTEPLELFVNTGYFIIDENSSSEDPHFFAAQAGGNYAASDAVNLGGRLTWYSFHSLDPAFMARNATQGNAIDGLSGSSTGSLSGFNTIETTAYARYEGIADWPMLLYGTYARNLDAASSDLFSGVGHEPNAYGVGFEVGNKKKWVKLGLGWWHIEANVFPGMLTESDLVDSRNNREGWALYGSRQVYHNTDLSFTLFFGSDEIDDDIWAPFSSNLPPLNSSVRNSERVRLQTNLQVKF